MPSLYFQLKGPCLTFVGNEKSDEWRLMLNGKCTQSYSQRSFTIISGNNSYDGFGAHAIVYIKKRPARSEVRGIPTDKPFDSNDEHRDIIHVTCPDSENGQPYFQVTVSLPPDAYQRLIDVDWTKHAITLSIENEIMGQALVYDLAPDGSGIEWHVDIKNHVFLIAVRLYFQPRGEQKIYFKEKQLKKIKDSNDAPTLGEHLGEQVLASVERITVTIEKLGVSIIKTAWVLIAVVLITSFI